MVDEESTVLPKERKELLCLYKLKVTFSPVFSRILYPLCGLSSVLLIRRSFVAPPSPLGKAKFTFSADVNIPTNLNLRHCTNSLAFLLTFLSRKKSKGLKKVIYYDIIVG